MFSETPFGMRSGLRFDEGVEHAQHDADICSPTASLEFSSAQSLCHSDPGATLEPDHNGHTVIGPLAPYSQSNTDADKEALSSPAARVPHQMRTVRKHNFAFETLPRRSRPRQQLLPLFDSPSREVVNQEHPKADQELNTLVDFHAGEILDGQNVGCLDRPRLDKAGTRRVTLRNMEEKPISIASSQSDEPTLMSPDSTAVNASKSPGFDNEGEASDGTLKHHVNWHRIRPRRTDHHSREDNPLQYLSDVSKEPRITGAERRRLRRQQELQMMQVTDPQGWSKLQQTMQAMMPYGWDKYDDCLSNAAT